MRAIVEKSVGAKDEVTILWRYTNLFINYYYYLNPQY